MELVFWIVVAIAGILLGTWTSSSLHRTNNTGIQKQVDKLIEDVAYLEEEVAELKQRLRNR